MDAFRQGQTTVAMRVRYSSRWPLAEFWTDKAKSYRAVLDKFINPILAEVVARARKRGESEKIKGNTEVNEGVTLLDHLVAYTDGMFIS